MGEFVLNVNGAPLGLIAMGATPQGTTDAGLDEQKSTHEQAWPCGSDPCGPSGLLGHRLGWRP